MLRGAAQTGLGNKSAGGEIEMKPSSSPAPVRVGTGQAGTHGAYISNIDDYPDTTQHHTTPHYRSHSFLHGKLMLGDDSNEE